MKITINEILLILTALVGFISSIEFLIKRFKRQMSKILDPINKSIINLDIAQCKNFLVNFLGRVDRQDKIDQTEKQRAYEIYDHYTNDLKQNSYIHNRWEEFIGGKNEK